MSQKNIKVSEVVHEKLESKKTADQTFDDVLREELGLTPDLDDMVAYFNEELAQAARDIVSTIDDKGEFDWVTKETDHYLRLDFVSPDSGFTIARADFTEIDMNLYYRDQHGDLTRIGFVQSRDNGDVYSYINKEYDGIDEISETIGEKARGAYRKWG